MTKEKYVETHGLYKGKHFKKEYRIWRVLGPAGPVQEFNVIGLDEAKRAVLRCWDYTITRVEDGKEIDI